MQPSKQSLLPLLLTIFLDVVGLGIALPALAVLFVSETQNILPPDIDPRLRPILYGVLIAAFPFAQFFGAPILGALSDRHGRKKLLLLSLGGTAVGYALFAIGIILRSVPLLLVSRLIDGFTGGNISIAQSAIADTSDRASKTRAFGLMGMTFGLGIILGPTLGGVLADPSIVSWFSPAVPFWFAAALSVLNMTLLSILFRETLHTRVRTKVTALTGIRNLHRAFATQGVRIVFLVLFFFYLGSAIFHQFFQVFLVQRHEFNQGDIGLIFGFIGICSALSQGFIVRPLSTRMGPVHVLRFAFLGMALTLPLLLVPSRPLWLLTLLPFAAIFQGLIFPNATALVSNLSGKESQGEGLGLNQSIHAFSQMLPPILAGAAIAIHPNLPILSAAGFILLAWLVFIAVYRPEKTEVFHEV